MAGGTSTCETAPRSSSLPGARREDRHRVGRGSRLEADGEEDHALAGVLARDPDGVERRVDHATSAPRLRSVSRSPREPGPQHVAEEVKMTSFRAR